MYHIIRDTEKQRSCTHDYKKEKQITFGYPGYIVKKQCKKCGKRG